MSGIESLGVALLALAVSALGAKTGCEADPMDVALLVGLSVTAGYVMRGLV